MASSTAPILAYMDDAIIDCRLRGIYRRLSRGESVRAAKLIKDTLNNMRMRPFDVDKFMYNAIYDTFYMALIDIAMKRFDSAHNRIRDLHYMINKRYISK